MPEHKKNNQQQIAGQVTIESDLDRLRRDVYRSDKEKFILFAQMLRAQARYKKVKITHK